MPNNARKRQKKDQWNLISNMVTLVLGINLKVIVYRLYLNLKSTNICDKLVRQSNNYDLVIVSVKDKREY